MVELTEYNEKHIGELSPIKPARTAKTTEMCVFFPWIPEREKNGNVKRNEMQFTGI